MADINRSRGEPRLIWCVDSPQFGGSEVNLIRLFQMTSTNHSMVIHGEALCPELTEFFSSTDIRTERNITGNSWKSSFKSIKRNRQLIRRFPTADFVIWAHHTDSNRWLQFTLALLKRRFIVVEQNVPQGRHSFARSRLSIPVKRFVARRAHRIILNSKSQIEHYTQLFRISGRQLAVISNARPISQIAARVKQMRGDIGELRQSLGIGETRMVVSVARLTEQKGQRDLIHAMSYLSREGAGPLLVLVGDGPDRSVLEKLAREIAPANVVFAGYQEDPLPWLAAADLFVLPSLYEGMPGALIEAMAAGLPCVATDIPGNRDLIQDGETGLLVPVEDSTALAHAINRMLSEPELASRCAESGYELVAREFDELKEKDAWMKLMTEVADRN